MARRSKRSNVGKLGKPVKSLEVMSEEPEEVGWKKLRLKYPVRYIYRSKVTGERYEWNGTNSIVSVHQDDVMSLLSKFRRSGCCGAEPQKTYLFVEVI